MYKSHYLVGTKKDYLKYISMPFVVEYSIMRSEPLGYITYYQFKIWNKFSFHKKVNVFSRWQPWKILLGEITISMCTLFGSTDVNHLFRCLSRQKGIPFIHTWLSKRHRLLKLKNLSSFLCTNAHLVSKTEGGYRACYLSFILH